MEIRYTQENEKQKVKELFIRECNSDIMVSRGKIHDLENLESIVAVENNDIVGILTFHQENKSIEIVSLDSFD